MTFSSGYAALATNKTAQRKARGKNTIRFSMAARSAMQTELSMGGMSRICWNSGHTEGRMSLKTYDDRRHPEDAHRRHPRATEKVARGGCSFLGGSFSEALQRSGAKRRIPRRL